MKTAICPDAGSGYPYMKIKCCIPIRKINISLLLRNTWNLLMKKEVLFLFSLCSNLIYSLEALLFFYILEKANYAYYFSWQPTFHIWLRTKPSASTCSRHLLSIASRINGIQIKYAGALLTFKILISVSPRLSKSKNNFAYSALWKERCRYAYQYFFFFFFKLSLPTHFIWTSVSGKNNIYDGVRLISFVCKIFGC